MVAKVQTILWEFWGTIAEMSPYLLFGFFMAGLLSVLVSREFVSRHLGGRGLWPVIKAAFLGVPLPLCSCSVIPVSMSLHQRGASRAATTAFLLSTPQTGVDSIFVTYSLLGPVMAIYRPLAAFITGVIGGGVTAGLVPVGPISDKAGKTDSCCCGNKERPSWRAGFHHGFVTLPRDIGKPLLLGLVLAAGLSVVVPEGFFADTLGTGVGAMLIMMLLGIPLYVCATASVPVAAALILKGITPGAALVFLVTGPATNAAGLVTLWKTLGRRTALIYLSTVALGALAGGLLFDALVAQWSLDPSTHSHTMSHPWWEQGAGVLLLCVLTNAMWRPSQN